MTNLIKKIDGSWSCSGDNRGFTIKDVNGECLACESMTVNGEAYLKCEYSDQMCEVCGYAPCDEP